MSEIPFTPSHVSVNRVRIVDLPGIPLEPDVLGQQAYDLVSLRALVGLMRQRAADLEIAPEEFDDAGAAAALPWRLEEALRGKKPTHAAAEEIASHVGKRLGWILLALHRGDPVNRSAREDWTASDWDRWSKIRTVWLGGGLAAGQLGRIVSSEASGILQQHHAGVWVGVSRFAEQIALLGAARYVDGDSASALCFDFGQTRVKRCRVQFAGMQVAAIEILPPLRVPLERKVGGEATKELGHAVLRFVSDVIGSTVGQNVGSGGQPQDVVCSVAAYVRGPELLGNGLYASMGAISKDVPGDISTAVSAATSSSIGVRFIHDGTAAAAVHAGTTDSAVLLIGTALGIGFPAASAAGLRPIAPELFRSPPEVRAVDT